METLLVVNVLPHLRVAFVVSTCGMQPLGAVGFLGNAFLQLFLFLDLLFLRVILLFYLIICSRKRLGTQISVINMVTSAC